MRPMSSRRITTIDCDPAMPRTVAAYLRVQGDEAAFIETNTQKTLPALQHALARSGLAPEAVRWIVVTHVHLDHAGGASALLELCPSATILAHPRAARHLVDPSRLVASATAVYGAERFAATYGTVAPAPQERVRALEDGETFAVGVDQLRVHHTRGHANHHFVVDDPEMGAVFTGDSFGVVYPQLQHMGPFALVSTSPTDFDPEAAHESVDRIVGLRAKQAYPTHFGPTPHIPEVAEQLHRWLDASARWLEAATANGESYQANKELVERAMRAELAQRADEIGLSLGADDWRVVDVDMDLNAQGIAFVAEKRRKASSS